MSGYQNYSWILRLRPGTMRHCDAHVAPFGSKSLGGALLENLHVGIVTSGLYRIVDYGPPAGVAYLVFFSCSGRMSQHLLRRIPIGR